MRVAIVKDGLVQNVVVQNDDYKLKDNEYDVTNKNVGPGDSKGFFGFSKKPNEPALVEEKTKLDLLKEKLENSPELQQLLTELLNE